MPSNDTKFSMLGDNTKEITLVSDIHYLQKLLTSTGIFFNLNIL